jgi:hypothetical protein
MMRWLGPCILATWASLGCGQSRLLDTLTDQDTRVRLAPESFRGSVPCSKNAPGALQMYVVHFEEVSESAQMPDAGLRRVTSDPVPCDRGVVLDADPGVAYVADVYGFDRAVTESPPALDQARWTASCGRGSGSSAPDAGLAGPTRAVYGAQVQMTGCSTFSGAGSAATSLVVDQAGALGDLRCGSGTGQVSRLEAALDGSRVSAACGAPLAFVLPAAARFYSIELTAYQASPGSVSAVPPVGAPLDASAPDASDAADAATDAAPGVELDAGAPPEQGSDAGRSDAGQDLGVARWRSQCAGQTLPGVSSIATCEPLQAIR